MSKVMFLPALWRLGTLGALCGRWCEQQPAQLCVQGVREPARIGVLSEKEHFARGSVAVF